MPSKPNKALTSMLKKIPIFHELSPSQIQKVLTICSHKTCGTNETIAGVGSPSDEMYVLLTGQVAVRTAAGALVTRFRPVTTIGESGVVAQERPRSVKIEAVESSRLLTIRRLHFDTLMRDDPSMPLKIYKNMIGILSKRFMRENVRLCEHKQLKKTVDELCRKNEIALDLLCEQGMSREVAAKRIASQYEESKPKILIVDDEQTVRSVVRRVLSSFVVIEADNGESAIQLAEKTKPDLVM